MRKVTAEKPVDTPTRYIYTVDFDEGSGVVHLVRAVVRTVGKSGDVFIEGRPYCGFGCKARLHASLVGSAYHWTAEAAWIAFHQYARKQQTRAEQAVGQWKRARLLPQPAVEEAA